MFLFLTEVEKKTGKKKATSLVANWCHNKTNSHLACSVPYEATVRE